MANSLGTLVVNLDARIASFEKALTRAEQTMQRRTRSMQRLARNAGKLIGTALGVAIGGGLTSSLKGVLNANDELAKLAQTSGISVEKLNDLSLGAKLAGTNLDGLANGLKRLQRNAYDSVAGLKEAADSFNALNINPIDPDTGALKDTYELLLEVSDKFSQYKDSAEKAAIAQRIFGKSGADLIPFLNQGSIGIKKLTSENRALGNILTTDVAKASERVNDNFTRLGTATEGLKRRFTTGILPTLEAFTNSMVSLSKGSSNAAESLGRGLGDALKALTTPLLLFKAQLDVIGNTIGRIAAAAVAGLKGEFGRVYEILTDPVGGVVEEYSEAFLRIQQLWSDTQNKLSSTTSFDGNGQTPPPLLPNTTGLGNTKTTLQDITREYDRQALASYEIAAGREKEFAVYQAILDAQDKLKRPLTAEESRDVEASVKAAQAADAQADAYRRLQGVYEEIRNPLDAYAQKLDDIDKLYAQGKISSEAYANAIFDQIEQMDQLGKEGEKTASVLADSMKSAADQISSSISDAIASASLNLESLRDLATSVLQSIAKQLIQASIVSPLTKATFKSLGLTGLASGGPVTAGSTYLVGERGPELLTMGRNSGYVSPNAPSTKTSSTNVVIENYTTSQPQVERTNKANGDEIIRVVIGAVSQDIARGGQISRTMQQSFSGMNRRSVLRS